MRRRELKLVRELDMLHEEMHVYEVHVHVHAHYMMTRCISNTAMTRVL